jgi:hypothetical protein
MAPHVGSQVPFWQRKPPKPFQAEYIVGHSSDGHHQRMSVSVVACPRNRGGENLSDLNRSPDLIFDLNNIKDLAVGLNPATPHKVGS